jgi:hypothetical protein
MENELVQYRNSATTSGCIAKHASEDALQLRVNVIVTTEKGTIAALRAARDLATNLGAQITLIAAEVVPRQCPLGKPTVPIAVSERKLRGFVYAAGIVENEVRIQLFLCRDQRQTLRTSLRPCSVVVIGGRNRLWPTREWKLKEFLTGSGHHVIFAEVGSGCGRRHTLKSTATASAMSVSTTLARKCVYQRSVSETAQFTRRFK